MFDEIRGTHPELVCKAGHQLSYFQTKDMENCLFQYSIEGDKLVGLEPDSGWPRWLYIYDHCEQCPKKTYHGTNFAGEPYTYALHPWCEWQLHLDKDGTILSIGRFGGSWDEDWENEPSPKE